MTQSEDKLTNLQLIARVGLVAVVLAISFATVGGLVATREQPKMVARQDPGTLVEVMIVEATPQAVVISAEGAVTASRQISLLPEVSGRVTWVSPNLVPGGLVRKGEPLVRLDARDYQLRVEQLFAQVDSAKLNLEIERSRKQIAEREWELLGNQTPAEGESLALRDPQLRTAQVNLRAAESTLEQAKLAVQKTVIRAPFNAVVQQKATDVGQVALPQGPLAVLVGTDMFWVQVSLPIERLSWLEIPGVGDAKEGSPARVLQVVGGETIERNGRVVRLLGDLDPRGRMARLLVEIEDPMSLAEGTGADSAGADMPLLLGSYVEVELRGHEVKDVIELPRMALRDDGQVYLLSGEGTLVIKDVDVVWRRPDSVVIRQGERGLTPGARVVISALAAPVEGMKLRTRDDSAADATPATGHPDSTAGVEDVGANPGDTAQGPTVAKPSR